MITGKVDSQVYLNPYTMGTYSNYLFSNLIITYATIIMYFNI